MVHITRTFARFAKQPFEKRRDVLRTVFREIVLESGSITSLTLNGGFLYGANLLTPTCRLAQISTMPDLTITLPAPIPIPVAGRRRKAA